MQIADYLGQYASTLANAPAAAPSANTGSTPVQNLVSAFTEMQEGAVFEGSVNAMDGSKILLGLSNGQTLSARLEGNISLTLGQSVFFQVKSNDGKTIAIKPFTGAQAFNPTIQKALEAAGMEMTKDTIDMVNSMMEEGMPIDRASLAMMRHTLMSNPQVSMQTAVLMNKLGIPVNSQMAAQFENYQNDQHAVLTQIQDVMDELPGVFAKASGTASDVLQLNQQLLSILDASGNLSQEQEAPQLFAPASGQEPPQEGAVLKPGQQPADSAQQTAAALKAALAGAQTLPEAGQEMLSPKLSGDMHMQLPEGTKGQEPVPAEIKENAQPRQIAELLTRHQIAELETQLKEILPKSSGQKLNTQLTAQEFLESVAKQLETQPLPDKEALAKLFSGKGYHTLLKDVMEQQWTVKPEDLKTGHKVEELYQRLNRQMGQIEQFAKQAGMNTSQLSQSAAQVRDNIEFMHQINQAYTYVQIPLKMANQNAHSDLYVYTNKRNLAKKEGELSAFLHLELENLGSTDVSIKMQDKNVSTKFYLSDDGAYDLIEAHLPELQARLEKLDYSCRVTLENREENVSFVEDFLQKSSPAKAAGRGMVHRYSFDVRA